MTRSAAETVAIAPRPGPAPTCTDAELLATMAAHTLIRVCLGPA